MRTKLTLTAALCLASSAWPGSMSAQYAPPSPDRTEYVRVPKPPELEEEPYDAGPYAQGRLVLSLSAGAMLFGSGSYLMVGGGVGVYLVDGLLVGVSGTLYLLNDPFIGTVTPELTYTLHRVRAAQPYIGVFYRRFMIGDDFEDLDSLGARAGLHFVSAAGRVRFGIGLVYEHVLACSGRVISCDDVYPEASFAFSL